MRWLEQPRVRAWILQLSSLQDLKRLSAVSSYLSSFVEGIDVYTKSNDVLHVSLTQHITSTGRVLRT